MIRNLCAGLLTACLLLGLVPGAAARDGTVVVALKLDSPWCAVGSEVAMVDPDSAEIVPVAENGNTLVPIRRVLEAFGGEVGWNQEEGRVTCTLNGKLVELTVGSAQAWVDGEQVPLGVAARAVGGRTFVPLRFVSERLGLHVGYEGSRRVVVVSDGPLEQDKLLELSAVAALLAKTETPSAPAGGGPIALASGRHELPSGAVSANVITVDMSDPRVSVKVAMVDNRLNATASFQDIVEASGAAAAVNGNFFESYQEIKDPIGPVMAEGNLLYGNSGALSSLGFTADNQMRYGRPAIFVRVLTTDGGTAQSWPAYNLNVFEQSPDVSVLYTPARGSSVPVARAGAALTVEDGVTTAYRQVAEGETLEIPWNGFVLYMGSEFTAQDWVPTPELGRNVTLEPFLQRVDEEGFELDGVENLVTGGPRLVRDGAAVLQLDPGFDDDRFTTAAGPRTAVGTTGDDRLLLVNASGATTQQMRELMLQLGCVDAINLDGGASTGMYYQGRYLATPGRELTTTLQIFVSP